MIIPIDRNNLPQDIPTLHKIICHLLDFIEAQETIIQAHQKTIQDQSQQILILTERLGLLEKHLFGEKSERQVSQSSPSPSQTPAVSKGHHAHGRRPLPKDLPRSVREYDLPTETCVCAQCGHPLTKIGHVISEQLESLTAQLYALEHRRAKYACRHCQETVVVAPMPLQPIDKGLPGPGLLAEVAVSKYQEHMPLHRQAQRFKRLGFEISRSTLCDWMMMSADLLKPLVDRMRHHLMVSHHVFSDDTPIRVLKRLQDQGKLGRFWIYTSKNNDQAPGCTLFEFTQDRKGQRPQDFLQGFEGYLQADAYSGYNGVYKDDQGNPTNVIELACWAHARRYFFESAQGTPPDSLAYAGLAYITKLYDIERQAREQKLTNEDLRQWRQAHAPPVLREFLAWLQVHQKDVLPKTSLGKAIAYTLNHWEGLTNYLQRGHLEIDNNRSERGIKPVVLGRKNYLFVGNNRGGEAAAIFYSLIETCKQHNINSHTYLRDVLQRISTHPQSKIDELLPMYWCPSPASPVTFTSQTFQTAA